MTGGPNSELRRWTVTGRRHATWWEASDGEARGVVDLNNDRQRVDTLQTLSNPAFPRVVGEVWVDGRAAPVLAAAAGVPLAEAAKAGELPDAAVARIGASLCAAIGEAHAAGLVHGRLDAACVRVDLHGGVHLDGLLGDVPLGGVDDDLRALGGCLFLLCTGRWPEDPGPHDPGPPRDATLRDVVLGLSAATLRAAEAAERLTPPAAPIRRVGRYELAKELGRGGMGVVFEAWDPELGRPVALKWMALGRFGDDAGKARFLAEARAVARLSHPDIVPVLDIGTSDEGPFFTMALVRGPTLAAVITLSGRVPWTDAARWTARIARALHHAHERGVVHRDVKPTNVILEGGTEPRLLDFGLALDADRAGPTLTAGVIGTPAYMAPEQAEGDRQRVGPRTDVYALGVVLFELLSGQRPFTGDTPVATLHAALTQPRPERSRFPRDVPTDLADLCLRALALLPEDRPASALAFAEALDRVVAGLPLERAPWRPSPTLRRAGLAAVALTALAAAALGAQRLVSTRAERSAEVAWSSVRDRVEALRAANDRPGAEAAVRAFTQANPGTEAAAAAWTALTTTAEPAQAARYFARAWQASPSLGGQTTALLALARAHVDGRNLWAADAAVRVLLDADPNRATTPEVVALQEQLRRARRAPPEAADSPLARQLAIGTRNPFDATAAVRFDARGDGDAEWYAVRSAERLLEPIHGGPAIGLPCDRRVYTGARAGAPGVLACQTGKDIALFVLRDGALVEVARRPADRLVDLATADVDGDGVTETYVAALRTLLRVEFDDGAATWIPAEPDTHAAGSVLTGVTPCDLDQDGRTELAVAVAEWGLYDVRLLTADPATGGLRVLTRTKLGTTGEIRPWRGPDGPGLAVVKADLWASRQVWPEGQERGQPAGIWLLGADGGRLTPRHRLDRSHPGWQPPLRAADLDGDGVDELAIFERGTTTIYQLQAGAWRSFHLPDTGLHAAGDIDGDGDDELLVSFTDSKQAWWLGTGTPSLPPPPAPTIPDVQVDAAHDAGLSSTWSRAATLARVGLIQEAGDAFAEIAMVTSDPRDRAEALRTAATLLGLAGDTEAATASWRSLAEADGRADTWAHVARASTTGNDPDSERAAYLKLRALDPDNDALANAAALKALDGPVLTANLAAPLTAPWRMPSAVGIRHDTTAGALHVDALPSVLLELPLQPAPDGLRIEVELTADQVEWSGSIGFNLEDDEGSVVMGLGIGGTGGGGVVVPRMFAVPRDGPAAPHHLELGAPVRMSATWSTARGYMVFESEHAGTVRRSVIEVPPPDPSRPLWLRVRAADAGELPRVRATIRRITVTGTAARDGLTDPYPERLRAAAGLAVRPPADDADGLAAWRAASGDFAGALAGVQPRPWDAGVVAWGLRTAPQGWARAVLEADPTRGLTALASVWQASITAGADQRAMALDTLAGLERRPVPSTPEAREALAALLELRVTALLDNQQPLLAADALAALDRVLALTPHLRSSRDAILSTRVALAMGRPDDAARLLDQALRDAPSPTLLADRLLVHPGLRALHGSPAWDRVRAYAFLPPTAAPP